jgi:hypothetical protein
MSESTSLAGYPGVTEKQLSYYRSFRKKAKKKMAKQKAPNARRAIVEE